MGTLALAPAILVPEIVRQSDAPAHSQGRGLFFHVTMPRPLSISEKAIERLAPEFRVLCLRGPHLSSAFSRPECHPPNFPTIPEWGFDGESRPHFKPLVPSHLRQMIPIWGNFYNVPIPTSESVLLSRKTGNRLSYILHERHSPCTPPTSAPSQVNRPATTLV